jgi:molybdate transport system substrate-binding protein
MEKPILCLLFLLITWGCDKPSDKITVATAANVQYAMAEIKKEFEQTYQKEIQMVVSSSGKLTSQIREGAPFDVFVSADTKYPQEIFEKGGSEEKPRVYAHGSLVLWSLKIPAEGLRLDILKENSVKKVAIPNPKLAPYGEAAMEVLKGYDMLREVEPKLVFGESIAQTAQYITTGSAEVGFNALSVVLAQPTKTKGQWVVLDSSLHTPIQQAAILLRHSDTSPKKETSRLFYDFLYSEKAKEIFRRYGYKTEF